MMREATVFEGRFFDGRSAAAHAARITIAQQSLVIEAGSMRVEWPYADLEKAPAHNDGDASEIRLASRAAPDALVILPAAARAALEAAAPDLFCKRAERRRMTALIGVLIGGSAAVAALLFIGVPAASGPMARATPKAFESQIGENIAAQINTILRPCGNDEAMQTIEPVIAELAAQGEVGFDVRFRIVRARMPNAFALPGGQVMATSGLIDAVGDDQEAFLAVMAHELGHVRERDSMRAVYRNAGLGILLEVITGGSGAAQQLVLVGGQLSDLSHSRRQEMAADEIAVEIMTKADLNPSALARAFEAIIGADETLIEDDDAGFSPPPWLSTHPDTEKRIEYARGQAREGGPLPLSAESWDIVRNACEAARDETEDSEGESPNEKTPAP